MTTSKPVSELARKLAERIFDLEQAGRIMHESWTATKRAQHYHHPDEKCDLCSGDGATTCLTHPDLIPWDDLPQKQKDINLNAFKDVFATLFPSVELAFLQMAALTRKQTIEECARKIEHEGKLYEQSSKECDAQGNFAGGGHDAASSLSCRSLAAAIREMEVKA